MTSFIYRTLNIYNIRTLEVEFLLSIFISE